MDLYGFIAPIGDGLLFVLTTYNKMMDTYPLKLGDESNLFNLHDSSWYFAACANNMRLRQ